SLCDPPTRTRRYRSGGQRTLSSSRFVLPQYHRLPATWVNGTVGSSQHYQSADWRADFLWTIPNQIYRSEFPGYFEYANPPNSQWSWRGWRGWLHGCRRVQNSD